MLRGHQGLAVAVLVIGLATSTAALAANLTCPGTTPIPIGTIVTTRVFNDCPTSVLTVTNTPPFLIKIQDTVLDCFGYANLHTWSFTTDGVNKAQFENCSEYAFHATTTLSGTGGGEGGLRLSPWWSPDADGKFMLNANTGEIACFGGRLPFYSFTAAFGLHYVKGTPAFMQMTYVPRGLSSAMPAEILYELYYNNTVYMSPVLAFDQGNPAEAPTYGAWGELTPAYVGGYVQPYVGNGNPVDFTGQWESLCFGPANPTPAPTTSWGALKARYR